MNKLNKLALAIASALAAPAGLAATALEEISVTVSPLDKSADTVAAPVTILTGDKLRNAAGATLGQTLESEPGMANASFGGGVGLPVIRGQSANRVKVLSDNLDVADASNTSSDHAVAVEPLLARRIEVLRGPAALRYGSGAIGGVVNVIDGRIPEQLPEQLEGAFELRHNSGNNQDAGVFRLGGAAGQLAWYLDGVYRENGNTRIPGYAIREDDHHHDDNHDDHEEEFNTRGFVANTDARAHSYSGGASWITDSGFWGFGVNRLENNYGIPLGTHQHAHDDHDDHDDEEHADHDDDHDHDHGHGHGEEAVRIAMVQTRYDIKGEHSFGHDYWDKLRLRLGYNDYQHKELEAHGDHFHTGTVFTNKAWEGRVELTHGGEWRGAYGLHLTDKDFAAVGDEAFIQPSNTRSTGFFAMKEREWGEWHLDLGGRLERVSVDPKFDSGEDFNLFGASAALQYFLAEHRHLSLGLTHAERAPVAEELFADGAHIAEARYLLGNDHLHKEKSLNLELGFHHHAADARGWRPVHAGVNVFYNRVGDYIYARNTGEEDHASEFDIYAYENRDANFYGAEAKVTFAMNDWLQLTLFGDAVRASFRGHGHGGHDHHDDDHDDDHDHDHDHGLAHSDSRDVPRMPPLRAGLALGGDYDQWNWEWRTTRAAAQKRAGAFESATDAYTRMDLTVQYRLGLGETDAVLFASGRNLLNEEIRNSASLLRDYAPEMGRSVEAGVRFFF